MAGRNDRRIEFRVLGPVDLVVDGRSTQLGHPKQRCVLAVLLTEANQAVLTEQLIDRVWGDAPPARARNVLSGYVTRLRGVFADAARATGVVPAQLSRHSGGYLLTVDRDLVDLHRFRGLVSAARAASERDRSALLDRALELWRGPAFAGTAGGWADAMRGALEDERLAAEIAGTDQALRDGRAADLVADLVRRAERHPLDERVAAQFMLALYRAGRQSDALAAYAAVRRRLADELGVDPGAELRRLHQQILRADGGTGPQPSSEAGSRSSTGREASDLPTRPSPSQPSAPQLSPPQPPPRPRPVPRQLPPAAVHFTGRAEHVAALDAWLSEVASGHPSTVVIAAIHGTGGVGKTALATYWAHQAAGHFPDGQLYLDLHGFDHHAPPMPAAEALAALLRALGVASQHIPLALDEQAALFRSTLAGSRVLVVLDNAANTSQVRPLLPGTPGCMVVVTSRNELSGLIAGYGARRLALDVLDTDAALTLLAQILGERRVAAEPRAARRIGELCAGLPLALRIAADHALAQPDRALAGVAEDLADERDRLDELATDDDGSTVRAVFSLSYHALKPEVARTFRLLGLHDGPQLSTGVVAALCGETPERVRRGLAVLCQGHLLERVGTDRYQMHDLLRIYAAERARAEESDSERRHTVRRMLDWYLATAVAADAILAPGRYRAPLDALDPPVPPPGFTTHREALAWCDTELANLVAAVRQASLGDEPVVAWQLSWSLWGYLELRKPWAAWLGTHRIGLACARQVGDRRAEAALLNSLGMAHYYPRRFAQTLECYRPALAIWRELGDVRGQASLINNIGNVLLETRRLDEAIEHFEQARTLYLATDDRKDEGVTLTNLAEACCLLGRFEEALRYGQRSLELVRETGNRRNEVLALCQAANALVGLGRFDDAAAHFERALTGSREIDDRQAEAWTLHYLAETAQSRGEPAQAREHWRRAVELFDELGDPQAGDIRSHIELAE